MKRRRDLLAISQMDLAERAEISAGYVGEVELGRKYPSPEILVRIAAALGVKPYRLLMGPDDVADAAGADAVYDAAGKIRDRINANLDELMLSLDPDSGSRPKKAAR
jgi:transcriptional regulator with XRE-family HTH domain